MTAVVQATVFANVMFFIIWPDLYGHMPRIVALGDNDGDACLLRAAEQGLRFEPRLNLFLIVLTTK